MDKVNFVSINGSSMPKSTETGIVLAEIPKSNSLPLYKTTKFWTRPNPKHLQTKSYTYSKLMISVLEGAENMWKILWKKKKIAFSTFPQFFHIFFSSWGGVKGRD